MARNTEEDGGYAFAGPLGQDAFIPFCITRTVRLSEPRRNLAGSVSCKVCGSRIEKGKGWGVSLVGERLQPISMRDAYLCDSCLGVVVRAYRTIIARRWLRFPPDLGKYPPDLGKYGFERREP